MRNRRKTVLFSFSYFQISIKKSLNIFKKKQLFFCGLSQPSWNISISSTHSGSGGLSFVSSSFTGAHLVHPSAAIGGVAAKDKAALQIHADLIVKSFLTHVFIDPFACISLAETKTLYNSYISYIRHIFLWLILKV